MKYLLLVGILLFGSRSSRAQIAPPTNYEFLTMTETESQTAAAAKLAFTPAFQGKAELPLEKLPSASVEKNRSTYQRNQRVIKQQLKVVAAAGWELVNVSSPLNGSGNVYLFRRLKKQLPLLAAAKLGRSEYIIEKLGLDK